MQAMCLSDFLTSLAQQPFCLIRNGVPVLVEISAASSIISPPRNRTPRFRDEKINR